MKIRFINLLLFFLFYISPCFAVPKYYLSICMIFRDEAPYLKEWIEFHRLMGVDHFYLCSHKSQDDYREVLKPYIHKGIVHLREVTLDSYETIENFNVLQFSIYNDCLKAARNESQWIAFIDADEFLFPTIAGNLVDSLEEFKSFGAVAVNWQMFGTSGIERLQNDQLMIEQLTHCAPNNFLEANSHIKCIVQPRLVSGFELDPHSPVFRPGYFQVNTDKIPFLGPRSPYIQVDQLRINHYWTRDEYYFHAYKIPRRNQWHGWTPDMIRNISDVYNQNHDFTIQRFVPILRKKMGLSLK